MEENSTHFFCKKCDKSFNHKLKLLVHKKYKHPKSESLPMQSTNFDPSERVTVKLWEFSRENYPPSEHQLPLENNTLTIDTKIVEFDNIAVQMLVIRLGRNFNSSEDQSTFALAELVDCEKENSSHEVIFQEVKEGSTVGSSPTSVPPSKEKPPKTAKRARNEFETLKEPQNKLRKISSPSNVSGISPEPNLELVETSNQTSNFKHWSKEIQGNSAERRLSCNYCDYSSKHKKVLEKHERTHTGKKPYKCQQCDYSATLEIHLQNHECIHTGEKAHEHVSGTSPDERSLERVETSNQNSKIKQLSKEIQGNSTERQFSCNYCMYTSKYKHAVYRHERTHTGVKPYKCLQCDYKSAFASNLRIHERIHTGEKPYKCAHCSYSANQKINLQIHERSHTGEKPYQCNSCDYAAKSYQALVHHVQTHTGKKPYKCEQCSYSSTRKANLQRHDQTHTGEKQYKCAHCSYSATRKIDVQNHERNHSGEKPYKCAHCSYSAKLKIHLQRHERTHTQETPQTCEYCSYSSREYSDLRIHGPIHTGEKPYQCDSCNDAAKTFEAMLNNEPTQTEGKLVFY